jgi:uncharacterized protein YodC (DUF2158 family)
MEASMNFQTGDVVRLKSGGPNMTVNTVKGDEIWCQWFDKDQKPQQTYFKPNTLEKI